MREKERRGFFYFLVEDIQAVRADFFAYLFLFFQFVYFSGLVRQFTTDEFLAVNLTFSFFLCLFTNRITRRSVGLLLFSLMILLVLNFPSAVLFGMKVRLMAGFFGRIFLGYLIILFLRDDFYIRFERLVTLLAFVSLPLFIIQLVSPDFFDVFSPISNSVLIERRLTATEASPVTHKYLFIFFLNGWGVLRNSGFMWEPAAFGAMLTWAALLNIIRFNFRTNVRLYVVLLAALTTFSLGTYVYLAGIIILIALKNSKTSFSKISLFVGVILLIGFQMKVVTTNFDMMSEKIELEKQHRERALSGIAKDTEISRLAAFELSFDYFINWPFGYGLGFERTEEFKYVAASPNGLMRLAVTWGLLGILVILFSTNRLINYFKEKYSLNLSWVIKTGLIIAFLLPVSGNPFYNQPLLFALIFGNWVLRIKSGTVLKNASF